MIRAAMIALCLWPGMAGAVDVEFCWIGDQGYAFAGRMSYPDALAATERVTEKDLTAFEIQGYHNGAPVGRWSLNMLTPETSWIVNFDPRSLQFAVGGLPYETQGQAWNANGAVNDCGTPGFGFNLGGNEQDVCIDGRYYPESGIDRFTPLTAYPAGSGPACPPQEMISLLGLSRQL